MKLYPEWDHDFEQRGSHGYWYRIGKRGNPLILGTCETCSDPCLLSVRNGKVRGSFVCTSRCRQAAVVSRLAKHKRLYKIRGQATSCAWGCQHANYDWANLTGNYDDPYDYAQMCRKCHIAFDTAIKSMSPNLPVCSICHVVSTASKYGICQTTPACRRVISRLNQQTRRKKAQNE